MSDSPAFPLHPGTIDVHEDWHGMTLLDYFAGQALIGMLSNPSWSSQKFPASEEASAAHWAYSYGRAMLAERQKGGR